MFTTCTRDRRNLLIRPLRVQSPAALTAIEALNFLMTGKIRTTDTDFDPLYCNMVEAGETAGILDTILQRLASYIERT